MRNIESTLESTTVRILSFTIENFLEQVNVVRVDSTIEGDGDHLRNLVRVDVSRDSGSIGGTETVGQLTLGQIAVWGSVRILTKLMLVMWWWVLVVISTESTSQAFSSDPS